MQEPIRPSSLSPTDTSVRARLERLGRSDPAQRESETCGVVPYKLPETISLLPQAVAQRKRSDKKSAYRFAVVPSCPLRFKSCL